MNRRALWLAVCAMAFGSVAQAGVHNMGGCGLGTMLFKNNVKGEQILAATTNGTFGNQTFGISSETLGCTKDGVVKSDKRRDVYAEVNLQKLSQEMAQGRGEYLSNFASLMGCKDEASKSAFSKFTQEKYQALFPTESTDSTAMLQVLSTEMAANPKLSKACSTL